MKFHVLTYGCQMNVYDSGVISDLLTEAGHQPCAAPDEAELLLINTCAIRDSAESRIHGQLGHMRRRKKQGLRFLAVCGCMAQNLQQQLLARHDHVDLVLGTNAIPRLPELVQQLQRGQRPIIACEIDRAKQAESEWPAAFSRRPAHLTLPVHVSVQKGCNYNCTFCIVPAVRGPERYRPVDDVLAEVARLEAWGVGEITLIGQTINAYQWRGVDFSSLIARVAGSTNMRVRFATSHPRHFFPRLIDTMATFDNIVEYVHLPLQSGSDRILKRMARRYTVAEYLEIVRQIRAALSHRPEGVSISSDVIVGFPGESEADFAATLRAQEQARWEGLYSFKFSPRPNTAAATFDDAVPDEVAGKRLIRLQELHLARMKDVFAAYRGKTVQVVVEAVDQRGCRARTRGNHVVWIQNDALPLQAGDVLDVRIEQAEPFTMTASPVFSQAPPEAAQHAPTRSCAGG